MALAEAAQPHPAAGLVRRADGELELPESERPADPAVPDNLHGVRVLERRYGSGGFFRAAYNESMPGSLLSGAFKFVDSMGTAIHYEGCFLDKPGCPIPHGPGIRREKNAVYTGQWHQGKEHGLGEFRDTERGESYLGEWRGGQRDGFGKAHFTTGDTYEGDWSGGKFHNRGTYVYCNGDKFVGLWRQGEKVEGTLFFLDGRVSRRVYQAGKLRTVQEYDPLRQIFLPAVRREDVHMAPLKRFAGSRPQSRAESGGARMARPERSTTPGPEAYPFLAAVLNQPEGRPQSAAV